MTLVYFTDDDKGVFTGMTKVRLWLSLAEDLKSYDSLGDGVVLDASGNEVQKDTQDYWARGSDGRRVARHSGAAIVS